MLNLESFENAHIFCLRATLPVKQQHLCKSVIRKNGSKFKTNRKIRQIFQLLEIQKLAKKLGLVDLFYFC